LYITRIKINHHITAPELRVIGASGENFGVLSRTAALALAEEKGLDLIEIAPTANPPVAKIMEFGKFQYLENKKAKLSKTKSRHSETKSIQVKIGTGERDLAIKANKASEFLVKGHRVKVNLFLPGRTKYMDSKFLTERLNRLLKLVTAEYKVASPTEKTPKGLTLVIEKAK
jgi:translation initiation factor IF-3